MPIFEHLYFDTATRAWTVQIYNNDGESPVLIAEDDGNGNLVEVVSDVLSADTGDDSVVDYTNSKLTIFWNSAYLASLTNNPILKFKYVATDKEIHAQFIDFLGEVFGIYKEEELDKRTTYFDVDNVEERHLDNLGLDHNWILDRAYSTDEAYLRRQLKFLYALYRSRRQINSINFAISIINKRVTFFNLLAKKGAYNDYQQYALFDMDGLFKTFNDAETQEEKETIAGQIEQIFNNLYVPTSQYYPTKHFLLDLALDILVEGGNLLNIIDMLTLTRYISRIKAETHYPHLQTYLGVFADYTHYLQKGEPFDYYLTTGEQTYAISPYRIMYSGPEEVESQAQTKYGAWANVPLRMNSQNFMNGGLNFNLTLGDVQQYLDHFKIGKGDHGAMTPDFLELDDPFFTSYNIQVYNDSEYMYMTLILEEDEGNDYPITEVGIFNDSNWVIRV